MLYDAAIIGGGQLVVNSASSIAVSLGMGETLVGLTIVAVGTSLPELVTSIVAAKKGDSGIAMGNVIGSSIFNILFILGGCSMITPLTLGDITIIDITMVVMSAVIPFIFAFTLKGRNLNRIEGAAMVAIYVGYVAWLISQVA